MKASEVIYETLSDLHEKDPENPARYSHDKMMKWLTAAMRQIVLMRPDANSTTASMMLVAGETKQTIPEGATQFLGLVRNMGDDGQTPGMPISIVNREDLNAISYGWHTAAEDTVIDEYTFNEKVPDVFYVTPRPGPNVYVEIEYSEAPAKVVSLDADLELRETWVEPMREYMMYRAYSKNKSSAAEQLMAKEHLSRFYLLLGEEGKARLVFSPNAANGGEVQR